MKKLEIKKGMRFGRLVILKELEPYIAPNCTQQHRRFLCKCDCGNEHKTGLDVLMRGEARSCGCLQKEMVTTHGKTGTREYRTWRNMKNRCNLKTDTSYEHYGSRGITVCERWNKFENFWEDMKDGYRVGLTIDRIDNDKGYYKENCRWATYKVQENNRNNNVVVKYNDHWYCPMELHTITNIPLGTIYSFEKKKVNK